jgi:hypothetical protein
MFLLTLVCGFVQRSPKDGNGGTEFGFPIVGLDHGGHGSKDPEVKRLKQDNPDSEGLLVKLAGGEYKGDDNEQKAKAAGAVIEFQCDPDRSGLEGLHTLQDTLEDTPAQILRRLTATADEGETPRNSSLQFRSFGPADDDTYILRLDWRTRYACDDYQKQKGDSSGSKSWGFFTWLIIM